LFSIADKFNTPHYLVNNIKMNEVYANFLTFKNLFRSSQPFLYEVAYQQAINCYGIKGEIAVA
jgi:hypothetical protein